MIKVKYLMHGIIAAMLLLPAEGLRSQDFVVEKKNQKADTKVEAKRKNGVKEDQKEKNGDAAETADKDKKASARDATIVITGTRTRRELKDVPVRTQVITKEMIEKSGAQNMYQILDKSLLSGVAVNNSCTNCNFSEIRMQGLESGYTLMLIDGLPAFSALAGVYGLQQINPSNIARIEVLKGASSSLYGSNALGGVINIISKEPRPDDPIVSLSYTYGSHGKPSQSAHDVNATSGIRIKNFGVVVTGGKHKNDYVNANGDKYTEQVERDNLYGTAKMHFYFLDDAHRITLLGRAIKDTMKGGYTGPRVVMIDYDEDGTPELPWIQKRAIDNPFDPDAEHIHTTRWEYGVGYRGVFKPGNSLEVNWLQTKHDRDATNGGRIFKADESQYLADMVYSHPILDFSTLTAGLNYQEQHLRQTINFMDDRNKNMKTIGAYIQDELRYKNVFEVVAGVRYDNVFDSSIKKDWAVTPRVAVRYTPLPFMNIRASYGWGFKVPQLFAEELHLCSKAPRVYVPKGLKSEKSQSVNAGVEFVHERITAEVNYFYTRIGRKLKMVFNDSVIPGFDAYYENAGNAYTMGVEANAELKIMEWLKLNGSFTYTNSQYSRKTLMPDQPGYARSKHMLRTPDYTARLGLDFDYEKWGLGANFSGRYTGMMYVQKEMIYNEDGDTLGFISRRGRFIILDCRVHKDFNYGGWNLQLFAGIDNITNYRQRRTYSPLEEGSAAFIWAPLTGVYYYLGMKTEI